MYLFYEKNYDRESKIIIFLQKFFSSCKFYRIQTSQDIKKSYN